MSMLIPNELDTSTIDWYTGLMIDNIFMASPLWSIMNENKEFVEGGNQITVPINYEDTPAAGPWAGGNATIYAPFVEGATNAVYVPAMYIYAVMVPATDIIQNNNKSQIVSIIESQYVRAEESLRKVLGTDIFGDGTPRNNGMTLMGLNAICTYGSDPAPGPYAGITRLGAFGDHQNYVGNAWWNGNSFTYNTTAAQAYTGVAGDSTFAPPPSYTPGPNYSASNYYPWKAPMNRVSSPIPAGTGGNITAPLASAMARCEMSTALDNYKADLIVSGTVAYLEYFDNLINPVRESAKVEIGSLGFKGLAFGSSAITVDDYMDYDTMAFIPTDLVKFRPWREGYFRNFGWRQPYDQLVNIMYCLLMGQVVCARPNQVTLLKGVGN